MSSVFEAVQLKGTEGFRKDCHSFPFVLLPLFLNSALNMNVSNKYKALNGLCLSLSSVLSEDQDSYLCNVTLFRKAVDDFRHKARENK